MLCNGINSNAGFNLILNGIFYCAVFLLFLFYILLYSLCPNVSAHLKDNVLQDRKLRPTELHMLVGVICHWRCEILHMYGCQSVLAWSHLEFHHWIFTELYIDWLPLHDLTWLATAVVSRNRMKPQMQEEAARLRPLTLTLHQPCFQDLCLRSQVKLQKAKMAASTSWSSSSWPAQLCIWRERLLLPSLSASSVVQPAMQMPHHQTLTSDCP